MATTNKIPGSSATVSVPSQPALASPWELVQQWDWTDSGSHTFADGIDEDFGGINWKSNNTAGTGSARYLDTGSPDVSSDGVKFIITGTGTTESRWWGIAQTGPVVSAALSDILSGYSLKDTLSIQALCDFEVGGVDTDGGYHKAGLVIFTGTLGTSGAGLWYATHWFGLGGVDPIKYQTRLGGGTPQHEGDNYDEAVASSPASFLELTVFPGTGWAASASLDTTYQEPMSVTTFRSYGNMELQLPKDMGSGQPEGATTNPGPDPAFTLRPDNMRIGMWVSYLTNTTRDANITAKFTGLRVMKRRS